MAFTAAENADLNQYWFSKMTMDVFVKEIEAQSKKGVAFLSAPSLYFSLANEDLRARSKVFEFDRQWEKDPGFVFYDFNNPEAINIALFGAFDMVVIDPPFITEDCWEKYSKTTRLLLAEGGKVLCTTIVENEGIMKTLMGCAPVKFQPSIPNLVYQYNTYTSYSPTAYLDVVNEEVVNEMKDNPEKAAAKEIQRGLLEAREQFISQAQSRPGREAEPAISAGGGWTRIPEGLTEYPASGPPEPPKVPEEYGPEYTAILARRTRVGEASKLIDSACKPLDKMWRAEATIALAETAGDQAKVSKAQEDLKAAREAHAAIMKELLAVKDTFPENEEGTVGSIIAGALERLNVGSITEDEFKKLAPDVQMKFKSPLFNHQKSLLAKLKELKKLAASK